MRKLEGILTLCGVALIIGLPMFLMFGGLSNDSQISSNDYINVLSYDDSIGTAYSDFEQSYSALDGTQTRDEIVYLYNDGDLINDSIITLNESIPLGIIEEPETVTTVSSQPSFIYIEPVYIDVPDDNDLNLTEESDAASSDKIVIDITEDIPLALTTDDEAKLEEFGDENLVLPEEFGNIENDILEIIDSEMPQGVIEITDSAAGDITYEESVIPSEEVFEDTTEEITDDDVLLTNDEILPEGLNEIAMPEEFDDENSLGEEILDDQLPEGITNTDEGATEVRTLVTTFDEYGNEIESYTVFLY